MRRKAIGREVDEVEDFYQTLISGELFRNTEDPDELACNKIAQKIQDLQISDDLHDNIKAQMLAPQLKTAIIEMVYGGRDPATVPYKYIRHALDNRVTWGDATPAQYASVNGPLRAIRVKCIWCMGGSADLVRSCSSVNCFLWSFRMGTNPFYGRIKDSTGEEEVIQSDDELDALEAEYQDEQAERLARMEGTQDAD